MTADSKTPLDHVKDVVNQLKEMRHYAKTNVEHLTAQWLMFDGELKKLNHTDRIEELMTRQGELHDSLDAEITSLEELVVELTPKDDAADAAGSATQH
jgi:superfamily II RNA helicase